METIEPPTTTIMDSHPYILYTCTPLHCHDKFKYGFFVWLQWSSLNQCKYVCSVSSQSGWKQEITIVGTVTTVIPASFQVPCRAAASLLSGHKGTFNRHVCHSENTFHFLYECEAFSDWMSWRLSHHVIKLENTAYTEKKAQDPEASSDYCSSAAYSTNSLFPQRLAMYGTYILK